jgi:O-succinylbenzoic acid--CoA ligase
VTSLRPVSGTVAGILALLRDWDAAADDPQPLVVGSSGSTGAPKRVVLSRRAMRASADATHRRLGGPGRWLLLLPPTNVAGLQVLFRSVRAGLEPVVLSDLAGLTDRTTPGPAHGSGRRYLSLVPTQLHRALTSPPQLEALSRLDSVLVGGGPLSAADRAAAASAGVPVVATYGMSETCGGCVYDGVPLDGVHAELDAEGQVLLAGPVLFDGYEDDPGLTDAALRDGWLHTRDLGRLDDGRLVVLGRADDVVVSGGVNVPVQAVAAALRAHPAVAEAEVVGVPDAEWGERVVAVVAAAVPVPLEELRALVRPSAWAPKVVVRLDALPLLPGGKVDRAAVRRAAGG